MYGLLLIDSIKIGDAFENEEETGLKQNENDEINGEHHHNVVPVHPAKRKRHRKNKESNCSVNSSNEECQPPTQKKPRYASGE